VNSTQDDGQLSELRRQLSETPFFVQANYEMMKYLVEHHRRDEALYYALQATRLGDRPRIAYDVAALLLDLRLPHVAQLIADRAIDRGQHDPGLYAVVARSRLALADPRGALEAIGAGEVKNPGHSTLRTLRSHVELRYPEAQAAATTG
jgi:hypothetical protein